MKASKLHADAPRLQNVMRLRILIPAMLLVLRAGGSSAQELEPREIAARARPAVVLIHAKSAGERIAQGSGFVVTADGRFITNRHVLEGADAIEVQLATGEIYDNIFLVSEDERRDLAVLRIPAAGLSFLPIGDDQEMAVGDPVYVMGNPMGLEGTFSNGLLSAKRTLDGVALLQITAPISSGSSGGPVLDAAGKVIGVATLVISDGQNLNMAVPARYAAGMLAINETPVPFSQAANRFNSGESASAASTAVTETEEDVEPWVNAVRAQVQDMIKIAVANNLSLTHGVKYDVADDGGFGPVHHFLYSGDGSDITIVGVCDQDCMDLNIAVFDPAGDRVAADFEDDARPVATFSPWSSGVYKVYVHMEECATLNCGYAIMSFGPER